MKQVIIACKTLQHELQTALQSANCDYPVYWIDSEYHLDPAKLRVKLQQTIDGLTGVEAALFVYGCCGNAFVGIEATTCKLIIPKTDDCISILMSRPDEKFKRKKETYFLTKGWIECNKGLPNEYLHTVKKYGEKRAKRIFDSMLKNYHYLMLIDTEAYQLDDYLTAAKELAEKTNLELLVEQGDLWYLTRLLTGPHDGHFCVIPKGKTVTLGDFGYM